MHCMIQTLESRRLFSMTIPSTVLVPLSQADADGLALKAALQQDVPVVNADLAGINSSFHGLPNAAQDRAMLSTLRKLESKARVLLEGDVLKIAHVGGAGILSSLRAIARFKAHPTNSTLQAAATAAIANLQTSVNALFTKVGTDDVSVGANVSSAISAINSGNSSVPAVQTAVAKLQSDFTSESTTLQTHFQSLQTDFQNLLSALNAQV